MGQPGQGSPARSTPQGLAGRHVLTLWIARGLIGLVFFFNVQCAVLFLASPQAYAPAYELGGAVGSAAIQAIGLLFLMWNVPYGMALWHPARHTLSLVEALVMQAIGLVGESLLLASLPAGHAVLKASLRQFILFDGGGLAALALAFGLVLTLRRIYQTR